MQLTEILALAAKAAYSALPAQLPAIVEYTQASVADTPESILLAAPSFNETSVPFIERRDGELAKRANEGMHICVDAGLSGSCGHIVAPAGVCGKFIWLFLGKNMKWRSGCGKNVHGTAVGGGKSYSQNT